MKKFIFNGLSIFKYFVIFLLILTLFNQKVMCEENIQSGQQINLSMDEEFIPTFYDLINNLISSVDKVPPLKPQNLRGEIISVENSKYIALSWDPSSDNIKLAGYTIYRNGKKIAATNQTIYQDKNVLADTLYEYKVVAFDAAKNYSEESSSVQVSYNASQGNVDKNPPTEVSLSLNTISDTSATINWTSSQDDTQIDKYIIYRDNVEIIRTSELFYQDINLSPLASYTYTVKAADTSDNISGPSNQVIIQTYSLGEPNENAKVIESNTDYSAYIDYQTDVDAYEINIVQQSELAVGISNIPQNTVIEVKIFDNLNNELKASTSQGDSISSTVITEPGIYYVKIFGKTGFSLEQQYTLNAALKNIDFGLTCQKQDSKLILHWNGLTGYTLYNVYRGIQSDSFERLAQIGVCEYSDANVVNGTKYYYKIGYISTNSSVEKFSNIIEVTYKAYTNINQNISQNTTWTSLESPYIIQNSITVQQGAVLTIQPGTILKFMSGVGISVSGKLNALGTENEKIIFTTNTANQYWAGIKITSTGEFNGDYNIIEYGGNGNGANIFVQGKAALNYSTIHKPTFYKPTVKLENTMPVVITNCQIKEDTSNGINIAANSSVSITKSSVSSISLYHKGTGSLDISENTITSGIGIEQYKDSTFNISDNIVLGFYPVTITLDGVQSPIDSLLNSIKNNQFNSQVSIWFRGTVAGNMSITNIYSVYGILDNVSVNPGIVFDVNKGVAFKVNSGKGINIYGKANFVGDINNKVIITSIYESPTYSNYNNEYWAGIKVFDTGELNVQYAQIEFGGNGNQANIFVQGKLNIINSNIQKACYFAANIHLDRNSITLIQNSTLKSDSINGLLIRTNNSAIIKQNVIDSITLGYSGVGSVSVLDNNITNGIKITEFKKNLLVINGNAIAGTHPIDITLDGIKSDMVSLMDILSGNSIIDNSGKIYLSGNVFINNSLPKSGSPYVICDNIIIYSGASLAIEAGTLIKAYPDKGIEVQGVLSALGTEQAPITFTSYNNPPMYSNYMNEYWKGIIIKTTGELNAENILIEYAGNGSPAGIFVEGKLTLLNSQVNKTCWNSSDIVFNTEVSPVLTNNYFAKGTQYGINNYKPTKLTVNASNNYWGSTYGPSVYNTVSGKWEGDGCRVSEGVVYFPWTGCELLYETSNSNLEQEDFASGIYSRKDTDFSTKLGEFDINIVRTYNSNNASSGSIMGKGWSLNLNSYLKQYTPKTNIYIVRLIDGSVSTFTKNISGTFTANDSRNQLAAQEDNSFILTTKEQNKYIFSGDGLLTSIKDRNDNTVKVEYNFSHNKISKLSASNGSYVSFTYDNFGKVIEIFESALNRKVSYNYQDELLMGVINPNGNEQTYSYDLSGYLTRINDYSGALVEEVSYCGSENKGKISQLLDCFRNVYKYSYDNKNRTTTITDLNLQQKIHWYDNSMYIVKTQDQEGKTTIIEYNVDSNGTNKFGEEKSITDRNGNRTEYQRDSSGNIIKIINPDKSYKELAYDQKRNLTMEKDELGKATYYVYDSNKVNLVKKIQPLNGVAQLSDCNDSNSAITQYEYFLASECSNIAGKVKKAIDPDGRIMTYSYDSFGNISAVINGENRTAKYNYNAAGWKIYEISPGGYKTENFYDSNGNIVKNVKYDGNGQTRDITKNSTSRFVYDAMGRKIKEVTPNLYDQTKDELNNNLYSDDTGYRYKYYDFGKLNLQTDPESNTIVYTYDLYGNIKTETKPNGAVYLYEYDTLSRLTKIFFKEDSESEQVLLEEYSYTILADKKTQKAHRKYINLNDSTVTIYTYDYAGRLVNQKSPDGANLAVDYNLNGTIKTSTDANGGITYYKYDGLNRLIEKYVPFENNYYVYNAINYDKAGNKKAEKLSKEKVSLNIVPLQENMIITNYTYNNIGKVSSVETSGKKVEYQYDDDGIICREETSIDAANKLVVEYINNYLGKPSQKLIHVKAGDLFEKNFDSTADTILTTIYNYDKNGNMISEINPNNAASVYTYDNLNRQTSISQTGQDENGAHAIIKTSTEYDWRGNKIAITDGNGNKTNYLYSKRGFLEKVIDANGGITAYYYDLAGRKTAEISPQNYSEDKLLSEMNRTEYSYDSMNREKIKTETYFDTKANTWISMVTKARKYDYNGNVIKELDALGYKAGNGLITDEIINTGYGIEYTYNNINKVLTITDSVSKEKGLAFTTKFEYDGTGRKLTETNAKGVITKYSYDNFGNTTKVTVRKTLILPEQTTQINTYDLIGNLKSKTDGNGSTINYEYNAFKKMRKAVYPSDSSILQNIVCYQYDALGNIKKLSDSFGTVDLYYYDNQNRVLSHTQQKNDGTEKITTSVRYDKNGNKRFEIDGKGNVKENIFDRLNRIVSNKVTLTNAVDEQLSQMTTYSYDKNNNLTSTTDWRGNVNTNVYDALNRLTEKKTPDNICIQRLEYNDNNKQTKSYDGLGNLTQYTYDKNNRLLSTVDTEGHTTSQTYDEAGNIKTKSDDKGNITSFNYDEFNRITSVVNAKGETTSYSYDLNGNMLTQTDGKGNTISNKYNVINKLVKRMDHGGQDNLAKTESYTYYLNGKLHTKTDRNGSTIIYNYDCHGRLLNQKTGQNTISFTYDHSNNILTMTDSTGTTVRTYDELNRLLTETLPNIGESRHAYDITEGVQLGYKAESVRDTKGNITVKVYDKNRRLKEVKAEGQTTTYNYYDNGSKKSVIYPEGSKAEYTYYSDGLLNTLINRNADGTIYEKYTYLYDAANNQISKTDSKGTTSYTYDVLNRLETVTEPNNKVTAYTFDASGNRLSETITINNAETITTYIYNEQNRLNKTITKVNGDIKQVIDYVYDNNGNVLKDIKVSYDNGTIIKTNTTAYSYDLLNQLIQTVVPNNSIVYNTYNGEGIRVEKSVDGVIRRYAYEDDIISLELDEENNQKAKNIIGSNVISRRVDNQTAYYFYNGHGDVAALRDNNKNELAAYYYDAFGNITEQKGIFYNNITYTGYQYDKETDKYYLIARMYDPSNARFLQEDTYYGNKNDPLSLNLYTYCHNEPIMYTDYTGHWTELVHKEQTTAIAEGIGFSNEYAKIIGKADNGVDKSIDTAPINIFSYKAQEWHFDRDPDKTVDSRLKHSDECFDNAVKIWNDAESEYNQKVNAVRGKAGYTSKKWYYEKIRNYKREKALEELGKGLHPLQDYDAHMDFGTRNFTKTIKDPHYDIKRNRHTFDDPRFDFNQAGTSYFPIDSGSMFGSDRYAKTVESTKKYLKKFLSKTQAK